MVHKQQEMHQEHVKMAAHLVRLPALGRPGDVHDSASTQHIIRVPDLDAIIAHHLGILKGNLLHLAPVPVDEQRIPNIIWVHDKKEDHALIHVAQGVAKDKDKSKEH